MPRSSDCSRRIVLVGLEFFTSVAAIIGGLLLVIEPHGSLLQAKMSALSGSPFADWRMPGVLLTTLVGGGWLLAGLAQVVHWRHARPLSQFAGFGLIGFEGAEAAWIGPQPLEVVFACVGAVVVALAWPLASQRRLGPNDSEHRDRSAADLAALPGPALSPGPAQGRTATPSIPNVAKRAAKAVADAERGRAELYWIPLGAGAHVVRVSGKLFEAVSAVVQWRRPRDLYHSALEVVVPEGHYIIEMTPVPDRHGERRGVVAEGPVGASWAGRLRVFRYEIHRWRDGQIPDIGGAVASPVTVTNDVSKARRILALAPAVPALVWGRDELGVGDMWNSNSVTSWLLAASGVDTAHIQPPSEGRAPGWDAGLVAATRNRERTSLPITDTRTAGEAPVAVPI